MYPLHMVLTQKGTGSLDCQAEMEAGQGRTEVLVQGSWDAALPSDSDTHGRSRDSTQHSP